MIILSVTTIGLVFVVGFVAGAATMLYVVVQSRK